jgi:ectoine hydroxylase-related dioxygenase (phytanoyl-CoA dioxygenase family)
MVQDNELVQALSNEEIEDFKRDGVIRVRKLYSSEWTDRIAAFLDDIISKPSPVWGARKPGAKFHMDMNTWLTNDEVRDFVLFGPSARIAQSAFGASRVTFYYDQIFVKEEETPNPTPWHHDFTFWPLDGQQIASLWTSVDPVDAESSALEFVAGSHLWPNRFRAIGHDGTDYSRGQGLEDLPDIEADRGKFNIVTWDLEPGDALLFHALTLHSARGNSSKVTKRRAITTRWCGDDVIYRPRGGGDLYRHGLKPGDPFSSPIYPQVLPCVIEDQVRDRMAGPIFPDPELSGAIAKRLRKLDRTEVELNKL